MKTIEVPLVCPRCREEDSLFIAYEADYYIGRGTGNTVYECHECQSLSREKEIVRITKAKLEHDCREQLPPARHSQRPVLEVPIPRRMLLREPTPIPEVMPHMNTLRFRLKEYVQVFPSREPPTFQRVSTYFVWEVDEEYTIDMPGS